MYVRPAQLCLRARSDRKLVVVLVGESPPQVQMTDDGRDIIFEMTF